MTRLDVRTWPEAGQLILENALCVLPCGAMEQHGPHLPLGTDTMIAEGLCDRLVEASGSTERLVKLPALAYGISPEHLSFAGTVSLTREAFCETVRSIACSLSAHGVRRLAFLNAHGGNSDALGSILRAIRDDLGLEAVLLDVYRSRTLREAGKAMDWHAGYAETSLYLALFPGDREIEIPPDLGSSSQDTPWSRCDVMSVPWRTDELSASGAIGDPSEATADAGEQLVSNLVQEMLDALRSLGAWGRGGWL